MRYIKLFENNNEPQIGDYVICPELYGEEESTKYTSTHAGQYVEYYDQEYSLFGDSKKQLRYFIKYDNLSDEIEELFNDTINNLFRYRNPNIITKFRYNHTIMCREEIVFWSKDKEEAEEMLTVLKNVNKYNL